METEGSGWSKALLLLVHCMLLGIGQSISPLFTRLYFVNGGKLIWLNTILQTGFFPLVLIPLTISYLHRCYHSPTGAAAVKVCFMNPVVFLASSVLGVITGTWAYTFTYGLKLVPASTSSLITATQLAFTAMFAFFLVKQKFTVYSINAIVLLTVGAVVLGLDSSSDRPAGESGRDYAFGFCLTVAAAALGGFVAPAQELTYRMAKQAVTYSLVLEIQMTICAFGSAVCIVAMLINHDFRAIPMEAKQFGLGETNYYVVVVCTLIVNLCFYIGCAGVLFYASAILSGIIVAVSISITELLAVVFFHEHFQPEKGVALFLSLWGLASYFYGENKQNKAKDCNDNIQDSDIDDEETHLLVDGGNP